MGHRNHRARGAEGVGFALPIPSGCRGSQQLGQTRSCRAGVPLSCPHTLGCSTPTHHLDTWEAGGSLQFYPTPKRTP